ncbi:MAG TPA: hypothetical protein VGK75_10390 [Casimicrobiaceae bacterium]
MTWVAVAAAAFKTVGALVEGNAQQAAYREAGAAHDYNAKVAEQNAEQAYKLADAQEALQRRKARVALGEQAAQIAESGVTYSGSALQVAKQSAANAELDSLYIQYQGDARARGYQAQAVAEKYGADVSRANARSARTAMYINAIRPGLAAWGDSLQPTTLGGGSGLGYGTAGSVAGGDVGPW